MAYITVEDLCNFTGKFPDEADSLPQSYCDSAMDIVANYLGYNPELKTYTQIVKARGESIVYPKARPVVEFTGFAADGVSLDAENLELEGDYITQKGGSVFSKGVRYEISYEAGFENVPEEIKTETLRIASLLWESASGNLAVSSTSFADTGSRVFNNFSPDRFLKNLETYRLKTIC